MNGKQWTDEDRDVLRRAYPMTSSGEIARQLGRSIRSVYQQARLMGLRKSEAFLSDIGKRASRSQASIAHRFREGHRPANKGKKMPPETYSKVAPTMFRKGNVPANHRPVGSERVNADGYVEIKVAEPNRWKSKHRVVWEQEYGPIPKGSNVQFKNGDRQDIRIENLYLISRQDQMKDENSLMSRYPEELRKVIRLKGTLKRQITLYNKKNDSNEQQSIKP